MPDGQVKYFEEFNLYKNCQINFAYQKIWGLVEMTFGLVNASYSLPEQQVVKMTFSAPSYLAFYFPMAKKKGYMLPRGVPAALELGVA